MCIHTESASFKHIHHGKDFVVVVDSSANIALAVSTWCFFELCFL